ncbi:MAG TPA: Gfo/Idh/MocA family oxidoreductase [Ktedonobacterales bacterium]|jgi:predicted dehydrogenase|nr:Gfo/Idh/MocA family oxidoreductase [Ktedonobacterales bacterium]
MSAPRIITFGIIGCGLMGREFASAAARWCHLLDQDVEPRIVAVCDANPSALEWFARALPGLRTYTDYHDLLADAEVEAVYCAVPHNLHAQLYADILRAGKHLLGEKPFGIDREAYAVIAEEIARHPELLVRCSSEYPFFPGAQMLFQWACEGRFGRIFEVESGYWHCSDLNPNKPINWKRRIATCGEYGCIGDLGMHAVHLPLRLGWRASNVRALLTKIVPERLGPDGQMVPCETWDNAILVCEATGGFPMTLSTKRIAPGHQSSMFLRIYGAECSAEFTTKYPKQIRSLPYTPGGEQAWHEMDVPFHSAYPTITGEIFEFGFTDAILQMWAAYCDELAHGREGMRQPFYCVTPEEIAASHDLFTAALESQRSRQTVTL